LRVNWLRVEPQPNQRKRRPRITFIAGFNCSDGIVLCADQLESDGVTKRYRCKLEGSTMNDEWSLAWGGAGDAHIIDKFTDKFKRSLIRLHDYNRADIELAAESALTLVHQDHPREPIQIVLALWSQGSITPKGPRVAERLLYRGRSDNQCIARETDYCIAGMDVTLASFILRNTFRSRRTTVDQAKRLAVWVTSLMKEYAEGVGGDTNVIACRTGHIGWEELREDEVDALEAELTPRTIGRMVSQYWDDKCAGKEKLPRRSTSRRSAQGK
jgi:20S proteasome alpha/beta subunit